MSVGPGAELFCQRGEQASRRHHIMLMRFDPFRERDRQFDRLSQRNWAAGVMPIDADRRSDRFYVHYHLPGGDPWSLDQQVEKNVLTVKAERSCEPAECRGAV